MTVHFARWLPLMLSPEWRAEKLGHCVVMVIISYCHCFDLTLNTHTRPPPPPTPPPFIVSCTTSFNICTLFLLIFQHYCDHLVSLFKVLMVVRITAQFLHTTFIFNRIGISWLLNGSALSHLNSVNCSALPCIHVVNLSVLWDYGCCCTVLM